MSKRIQKIGPCLLLAAIMATSSLSQQRPFVLQEATIASIHSAFGVRWYIASVATPMLLRKGVSIRFCG